MSLILHRGLATPFEAPGSVASQGAIELRVSSTSVSGFVAIGHSYPGIDGTTGAAVQLNWILRGDGRWASSWQTGYIWRPVVGPGAVVGTYSTGEVRTCRGSMGGNAGVDMREWLTVPVTAKIGDGAPWLALPKGCNRVVTRNTVTLVDGVLTSVPTELINDQVQDGFWWRVLPSKLPGFVLVCLDTYFDLNQSRKWCVRGDQAGNIDVRKLPWEPE